MQRFSPQALLLDFYGTVVEEDDVYIETICQQVADSSPVKVTASEVGSYWSQLFSQMCADSFGASFRPQKEIEQISLDQVLHYFHADLDSQALSQIMIDYWSQPTIFPESQATLTQCDLPICLVSNIDNQELQSALNHHNLSFDWVVSSEDCQAYKPRREMFEQALGLVGLGPEEVLHVGDSLGSDVRGAKLLHIPVLWINRKQRQVQGDSVPDYVANDLTGLMSLLQRQAHQKCG